MIPDDSFEKSGKSKCKTKKFGKGSDVPAQRENSENGVVDVRMTEDCRQLLSFCA